MKWDEILDIYTLLSSFGLGVVIAAIVFTLFFKNYIPSYLSEKAKNLAKVEDIEKITKQVEDIKHQYSSQLQNIAHQNNHLLEQAKGRNQLRLAALDKRLQAHQEAFELWRKMILNVHGEENSKTVLECQDWYNKNCLYLDPESRQAFITAYGAMQIHPSLLHSRDNIEGIKNNFLTIISAGDVIVRGAELPPLGEQEIEYMTDEGTPNKLSKRTPESGAAS